MSDTPEPTIYYVPNLGPGIYMTEEAHSWAERVGQKPEKKEFTDLEKAKSFALRIHSQVTDKKGTVLHDPRNPEPVEES